MPVCRIALMLTALTLVCAANAAGPESDHAPLAAQAGVSMPPARVLHFSAPEIVTRLLDGHPRVGLYLPFRVLAQLHYGEVAKPHRMLDKRLSETFAAVARP